MTPSELADGISGASAADIGRIALNHVAWRSASRIFASCQKASAQQNPAYPYTTFPFQGKTDFAASGTWLPFGNEQTKTFMVYKIKSCSHAFPFRSLSYVSSDRKFGRAVSKHGKGGNLEHIATKRRQREQTATDTDPGNNQTQKRKRFSIDHRFPDLKKKRVWRKKQEVTAGVMSTASSRNEPKKDQVAFGEPAGINKVCSIDPMIDSEIQDLAELPHFVLWGLTAIHSNREFAPKGSRSKLVVPKDGTELIFCVAKDLESSTRGWLQPNNAFPSTQAYRCRACYVELTSPGQAMRQLAIFEGRNPSLPPVISATRRRSIYGALSVIGSPTFDLSSQVYDQTKAHLSWDQIV